MKTSLEGKKKIRGSLKAEFIQKTTEIQDNLDWRLEKDWPGKGKHCADPRLSVIISAMNYEEGENIMESFRALLQV